MADDIRYSMQSIFDGREGVFEVFMLQTESEKIVGIERAGGIFYFMQNKKRNHQGYVIGVLPESMQEFVETVSNLSYGYFRSFSEACPLWAQYLQDGIDLRFDRTALVKVYDKWQFMKSFTYNEIDASWHDLILRIGCEFFQSVKQMTDEIHKWNGFSTGDHLTATARNFFAGYKKIRRATSFSKIIDQLIQ